MTQMLRRKAPDSKTPAGTLDDPITRMTDRLMAQALSIDAMFDRLAEHAAIADHNDWPTLTDRYTRLALRAQSNYRYSLETLVRTARRRQAHGADAE